MKKTIIAAALSAALLTAAPFVSAIGVPTLDATTGLILTGNAVQQAQQALTALNTAKDAISQAKAQYDDNKRMTTGNDKLGRFLNNPELNKIMPLAQWDGVYRDVKDLVGLRKRYGLQSDSATVQQAFDKVLSIADALERNYNASTERVKNAEELRAKLDEVETPQQKQDLQLRYQQELLEVQNQNMRMANMQMLVQQNKEIENQKRAQAFNDYMKGKTKVLPKYD